MTQTESPSSSAVPFVLPFVLYMIIGMFPVDIMGSFEGDGFSDSKIPGITPETWYYILKIGLQIAVCTGLLIYFRKVYLQQFPFRISPLSFVVGFFGVILWVAACYPQAELKLIELVPQWIGFDLNRPSFNPFLIQSTSVLGLFLTVRFMALVLVVPLVEELFLRGWLVRWIQNPNWQNIGFKGLSVTALFAASIYGVAAHPLESIAAFLWFGMVTWLMVKTNNLWDCVVAHAVTNLLLGLYIIWFEQWHLW